jgi:hypothetical protein
MRWNVAVVVQALNPLHTFCTASVQERGAAFGVAVIAVESELERDLLTHDLSDISRAFILDDAPFQKGFVRHLIMALN